MLILLPTLQPNSATFHIVFSEHKHSVSVFSSVGTTLHTLRLYPTGNSIPITTKSTFHLKKILTFQCLKSNVYNPE